MADTNRRLLSRPGVCVLLRSLYPVSYDASVLHDLCGMRDDDFCGIFTTAQLKQLIIDISIY